MSSTNTLSPNTITTAQDGFSLMHSKEVSSIIGTPLPQNENDIVTIKPEDNKTRTLVLTVQNGQIIVSENNKDLNSIKIQGFPSFKYLRTSDVYDVKIKQGDTILLHARKPIWNRIF